MKIIPVLEMPGWRAVKTDYKNNQATVKYDFVSERQFKCKHCAAILQRRGYRELRVLDAPYLNYDIELIIKTPRVYCPHCQKYGIIRPESIHPKRCLTLRLMKYISLLMVETSAKLLSKILRLSQSTILRADKDFLKIVDTLIPISLDGREALIIDEKYLGQKMKFITCVIDGYSGEILWVKEGKGSESLSTFFQSMTKEQRNAVKIVSIDRGNAYYKAVKEHLPQAAISFDPFHIIKNASDALDKVRREVMNKLPDEEKKYVKGFRWVLLRGEENLSENKQKELDNILKVNESISKAHYLKEQLRLVFQFGSFKRCAKALNDWIGLAEASSLNPFEKLAASLYKHAQEVLNYFIFRLTSGRIEGVNSMISRLHLKTRGLPSVEYLKLKLRQLTCPKIARLF